MALKKQLQEANERIRMMEEKEQIRVKKAKRMAFQSDEDDFGNASE